MIIDIEALCHDIYEYQSLSLKIAKEPVVTERSMDGQSTLRMSREPFPHPPCGYGLIGVGQGLSTRLY